MRLPWCLCVIKNDCGQRKNHRMLVRHGPERRHVNANPSTAPLETRTKVPPIARPKVAYEE
jgi:hypothetical protein